MVRRVYTEGLTRDGTPKLSDFGLAREVREDQHFTQTGLVIGTPVYMAPEQALGSSPKIGPAADVHGLGVLLYELLCGHPPFRGATLLGTLMRVMNEEAELLSRRCSGVPPIWRPSAIAVWKRIRHGATSRPARWPTTCAASSTASRSTPAG